MDFLIGPFFIGRFIIGQNTLFKKTTELEELKLQMRWDEQALEAWLDDSARRADDIEAVQKYARQDEAKVKELNLQMEALTGVMHARRALLQKEVVETRTAQVELQKTSDEFSKAHDGRRELIGQWEATIEQLRRRDDEIDVLGDVGF